MGAGAGTMEMSDHAARASVPVRHGVNVARRSVVSAPTRTILCMRARHGVEGVGGAQRARRAAIARPRHEFEAHGSRSSGECGPCFESSPQKSAEVRAYRARACARASWGRSDIRRANDGRLRYSFGECERPTFERSSPRQRSCSRGSRRDERIASERPASAPSATSARAAERSAGTATRAALRLCGRRGRRSRATGVAGCTADSRPGHAPQRDGDARSKLSTRGGSRTDTPRCDHSIANRRRR